MKSSRSILSPLAAALLALPGTALAQTATTDPVGFITLNIAGGGTITQPALSFNGLGLTPPVAFQGTADSVGTNTLVINSGPFTLNQFNATASSPVVPVYNVELTSGASAGVILDVASNTTTTITTVQNLPAGVVAGVTFKVRPHWTITSVFGPNTNFALQLQGGSVTSADHVLVYDGVGYNTYYYQTKGAGGVGWRSTQKGPSDTTAGNDVLYPDEGVVVQRNEAAGVSLVVTGAVKTGQTSVAVQTGLNFVGNIYASSMTLADSGIYTGNATTGLAGGSVTGADQLYIWNATTLSYDTYYYQTKGFGGIGWRSTADPSTDASLTQIPIGVAVVVNRKGTGFSWIIPQHPKTI